MKILALVSSFRKNGNTAGIVELIASEIEAVAADQHVPLEFETLYLAHKEIEMCRGCRTCFDRGEDRCPLKDDVPAIKAKLDAADAFILASPVYVDDVNNYRIQRCSYADGWTCSTIHGTGSAGGGYDALDLAFGLTEGLGTGGSGDLYIADSANGRVKECSADMFGWTCNTFVDGIDWPAGVAVDATGDVYVSSYYEHVIHKYDSDGNALGILQGVSDKPYDPDGDHYKVVLKR